MANALFFIFCLIQVAFLFTDGLMELPDGVTYAEYARNGFFQLLFVSLINFGVIAFFLTFIKGIKNNRIVKIMLLALCVFTAILIVSSFYRMFMYVDSYGFTFLRTAEVNPDYFHYSVSLDSYYLMVDFYNELLEDEHEDSEEMTRAIEELKGYYAEYGIEEEWQGKSLIEHYVYEKEFVE